MCSHLRRSLCLVHPGLETAVHHGDGAVEPSVLQLYNHAETLGLDRLVDLKQSLRKTAKDDFWHVLCKEFAKIVNSQYCFFMTRASGHPRRDAPPTPPPSESRSCMAAVWYFFDDGTGDGGQGRHITLDDYDCPCSFTRSERGILVPPYKAHLTANNPYANEMAFACAAYLSFPLYAGDECVAHFCVMWSSEGLSKKNLSWGFLELLFRSLEDLVAQRLTEYPPLLSPATPQCTKATNDEEESLIKTPAALERYAKKISHELRTPLQGIMGITDLMHAAVHDASSEATSPTARSAFKNLKEDIEAVQSSSRRAVDAADNVVQAYELNMLLPEAQPMQTSVENQDSPQAAPRGTKRRYSESNVAERWVHEVRVEQPSARTIAFKTQQEAVSAPYKLSNPQPSTSGESNLNELGPKRTSVYSPIFLQASTPGLQLMDVRSCTKEIVHECIKREDCLQTIGPYDSERGQKIEVHTKDRHGATRVKIVTWDVDPAVPEFILVEQRDMAKMISCVLHNALKFTEEGHVTLQIQHWAKRRSLAINIKDTGPGISADFRSEIFKPFSQEDDSTSRRKEGLGLGLVVAKGLAQRLRGELNLVSAEVSGPNRGSEFLMRIPISPSAEPTPTSHPNHDLDRAHGRPRSATYTTQTRNPTTPLNNGMIFGIEASTLTSFPPSSIHATISPFSPTQRPHSQPTSPLSPPLSASPFSKYEIDDYWAKRPCLPRHLPYEVPNPRIPHDPSYRAPSQQDSGPATFQNPSDQQFDSNFAATHPLNFLVAEDNAVNRKLLVKMLGKLGYDPRTQIREACDGLDAVRQIKATTSDTLPGRRCSSAPPLCTSAAGSESPSDLERPATSNQPIDVILMDLWMPNMDGYEASEQILQICKAGSGTNEQGQGSSPPPLILAVTADATQASLERAARAGMGGLMLKPFGMRDLARLVREGWARRQRFSEGEDAGGDSAEFRDWRTCAFS